MSQSHRAMPDDVKAERGYLSTPEFLAALERSGILTDAQWRHVRDQFGRLAEHVDSLKLAHLLIKEGTLTRFQARRLLKGKKSLEFGRYALLDHIGQGARGRVFKARHRLMDRVVALKLFVPDSKFSKTSLSRFFREMKIVGLLDHPNVVRAIDADVHDDCPYIVMEYLEGEDLERVLSRRGPLPAQEVIAYMAQAARGLAHAHERGVIHRDIKPTNVFLVSTGMVKVLDLGFGELVGKTGLAGNVFDTDEGIVVGTTDFMSPEQVKDKPIDARTDLFSLGCTMYRLLTGKYAFPGKTREDRLLKRIRRPHVPITKIRTDLSDRLVSIVDRLLATRPADRFNSAAEVAEALEALITTGGRTESAASASPATTIRDNVVAPAPPKPEAPADWSMIESALRSKGPRARGADDHGNRNPARRPSSRRLSSHRRTLEADGSESGREVHEKYRNELIQMKKVMAELHAMEPADQAPATGPTWLERAGEWFGDFLAEPSAFQIILVILAVLLVFALALSVAIG